MRRTTILRFAAAVRGGRPGPRGLRRLRLAERFIGARGRVQGPEPHGPRQARHARGRGERPGLAGLRRGRQQRPQGRLGHRLREGVRLQGHRQDVRHLGRGRAAHAHRSVRRGLGLRRRHPAPHRRRRRRADQHRPDHELPGHLRQPEDAAVELGPRRAVRHPPRPRRQPADVPHRPGEAGSRQLVAPCSTRRARRRARSRHTTRPSTSPTPRCTSWRPSRTSGSRTPTPSTRSSSAAAVDLLKEQKANVGEYWSDYLKEIQAFKNGSSTVGTTWQVIANLAQAREGPGRGGAAQGGRDRLVRHLDGGREVASTRPVPTSSSTTSSRPRPTPPSPSTSVRRRPTRRPAPRRPTRTTAPPSTRRTRSTSPRCTTGPPRSRRASTAAPTSSAPTTPSGPRRGPRSGTADAEQLNPERD